MTSSEQSIYARTPEPPYYAVIFSVRRSADQTGYAEMAAAMEDLAARQPGYLGIENAGGDFGITISYWRDLDAIGAWKRDVDHLGAQRLGRERWYESYRTRIALVEREYGWER